MSRTYVFTNHKGRVGKSTSATNTALGISAMLRNAGATNPRVLLIDTNSQAHATLVTTGRNDFDESNSLYTVLMADRQKATHVLSECLVQSHWDENLHVLSASPLLEQPERELQGKPVHPIQTRTVLRGDCNRYTPFLLIDDRDGSCRHHRCHHSD